MKENAAPPPTPQQQAVQAYKTSNYHGISEREVMAEAFRMMVTHLYTAKDAFAARKLDVMCDYNIKTLNIINLLASTLKTSGALDDPQTRDSALFMAGIYNEVFVRLTNIVQAESPTKEFEELIALLTPVYRRWLPTAPENAAAPSASSLGSF